MGGMNSKILFLLAALPFAVFASQPDDNLFAGALDAANLSAWSLPKTIKAQSIPGGVRFSATAFGDDTAAYTVDLPPKFAGKSAQVEFVVKSLTPMVWYGTLRVVQLDAQGKKLLDDVSDHRWTSHMRPFNKLTRYCEDGTFHPRAAKLRVEIGFRSIERNIDAYGMPFKSDAECKAALLPQLEVSKLEVRAGALLPFPKYDDAGFTAGVSGADGDTALVLGGERAAAFWYQTHSLGAFSAAQQFRDERDCFFPTGAGTVEAWFKGDWAKMAGDTVTFFQYHQGYVAIESRNGKGTIVGLTWNRRRQELSALLLDGSFRKFQGKTKVALPTNAWFHLALQWRPGGEAQAFLDGKRVLTLSLAEYQPFANIADPTNEHPNDQAGMEFFAGCDAHGARYPNFVGPSRSYPPLEGAMDLLRVSSSCRYSGEFTPARTFKLDGDTRALFGFDRSFDGTAGGGLGFIPGSYRASCDRVDHKLVADGKSVQYFPAEILKEAHPDHVLDINNYPVMPTAAEYHAARRERRKVFEDVKIGDRVKYSAPEGAYADFVEIANTGASPLVYPIVLGKGELDVRSFGDLGDGLNLAGASDRDKANRLFQMVINASDYFMNHNTIFSYGSDMPRQVCYDAMVVINSYCGFECGPLNNLAANMFATVANCPAAQTGGYGHSFEEVFYDGKNHIYDLSAQKFFPAMDNETAAYLREVGDQPGIHNRVNYSADHFMRKGSRGHWGQNPDYRAKVGVVLNPGERFRVWYGNDGEGNNLQCKRVSKEDCRWDKPGAAVYAPRYEKETGAKEARYPVRRIDRFFPDFSSGFICFDGRPEAANPAFTNVTDSSFCYHVKSGYTITWACYGALLKSGGAAALEISTNFRDFRPLPAPAADGKVTLDYQVRARHGYWIRVKAPISAVARFSAATEVIVNRRMFPGQAKPGLNELHFKAVSGEKARVTVQWRENVKSIGIAGGVHSGTIPGFERQTVLLEPSQAREFALSGVSAAARATATTGLTATVKDGRLTLSASRTEPFVGFVTIVDGEAKRELTVIVCAGARLATAADGKVKGRAELLNPGAERAQAAAMCRKLGDGVDFKFSAIKAGEYLVFGCTRFEGGLLKGQSGARVFEVKAPGVKSLSRELLPGAESKAKLGAAANGNCDFLKALYGHKGERGNWKWDYPHVYENNSSNWSGWEVMPIALPSVDTLTLELVSGRPNGVELAGVLIIPATVSQDFRGELKKLLCGLNCQMGRIHP